MSGITLLNIAWQSLAFSTVGWAVIHWTLRDARKRAWAALATLVDAFTGPCFMNLLPHSTSATPTAASLPALWQPDWKVELAPVPTSASPLPDVPSGAASPESLSPSRPAMYFLQIYALWTLGVGIMFLRHLGRSLRCFAWHQRLRPPSESEQALLPSLASAVPVRVFVGPGSPCVSGLLRPVVAVPHDAFGTLSASQWLSVLRHEQEHLRAGDTRVIWMLEWLEVAFWWNPFFHGLVRQWSQAREELCDQAALNPGTEPSAYAELLLLVAGWSGPAPCRARMATSHPARRLRARIMAILRAGPAAREVGWLFTVLYGLLATLLLLTLSGTGFAESATEVKGPAPATGAPANAKTLPLQIHFQSKWIEVNTQEQQSGEPLALINSKAPTKNDEVATLAEPAYQDIIRALTQRRGVNLLSAPSVTTRIGQKATVEIVRELRGPAEFLDPKGDNFLGIRNEFEAVWEQGRLKVSTTSEFRTVEGQPLMDRMKVNDDGQAIGSGKLVKIRKSIISLQPNGHTLILPMGHTGPGRDLFLFVTASLIKPSGEMATEADVERERLRGQQTANQPQLPAPPSSVISSPVTMTAHLLAISPAKPNARLSETLAHLTHAASIPGTESSFVDSLNASPSQPLTSDAFTLLGVYTARQFEVVLRSIKLNTTADELKEFKETASRERPGCEFPTARPGEPPLRLSPVGETDSGVLDLTVSQASHGTTNNITTAVSIWDGQTIVLGRTSGDSEEPTLDEVIFITLQFAP